MCAHILAEGLVRPKRAGPIRARSAAPAPGRGELHEPELPTQRETRIPWLTSFDEALQRARQQVWTPTIPLLSAEGQVCHERNGYVPPSLYLAQLLLGRGKAALKRDHVEEAARLFEEVVERYPLDPTAAEALYWAAVARYKASHQASDLTGRWQKPRGCYPEVSGGRARRSRSSEVVATKSRTGR